MTEPSFRHPELGVIVGYNSLAEFEAACEQWESEQPVCECEIDWNCPLHQNRVGTFIETRYQGLDDDEARAHGAWWDL